MEKFCEQILENDLNPFILFTSNGKLQNYNKESEFLFNFVKPKELYELAIQYASISYGFNKKFINLKFKKIKFYAIMVGYINDNEIALRLYKEVSSSKQINIHKNYQLTNIYTLLNLSKNTSLGDANIKIEEIFDVSIPELKIDINEFLLFLNNIFTMLINQKTIKIEVFIIIGEYKIINQKKYSIVCIKFTIQNNISMINFHNNNHSAINIFQKDNEIKLEIPLII